MNNPTNCVPDYSIALVKPLTSMPVPCAWCMVEANIPLSTVSSHGICTMHASFILAESRARRAMRLAAKGSNEHD